MKDNSLKGIHFIFIKNLEFCFHFLILPWTSNWMGILNSQGYQRNIKTINILAIIMHIHRINYTSVQNMQDSESLLGTNYI